MAQKHVGENPPTYTEAIYGYPESTVPVVGKLSIQIMKFFNLHLNLI